MAKRIYGLNPISAGISSNALYEPQRSNHFEVYINLPAAVKRDVGINAGKYLTLATRSFALPTIGVETTAINFGNSAVNIPTSAKVAGTGNLTCVDYIGADIERILYTWQNIVHSPQTGQMGIISQYKTDAQVIEYSAEGSSLAVWKLEGLFPTDISYGDLSKDSTDLKQIQVTLAYDVGYKTFGDSTRSNLAANAAISAANMTWKAEEDYAPSNAGGPLGSMHNEGM